MPVIDHGRVYNLRHGRLGSSNPNRVQLRRGFRAPTLIEGKKVEIECYSPRKTRPTLADLTLIREHYGVVTSEALRIAVHLTSDAIRANKARVTLP